MEVQVLSRAQFIFLIISVRLWTRKEVIFIALSKEQLDRHRSVAFGLVEGEEYKFPVVVTGVSLTTGKIITFDTATFFRHRSNPTDCVFVVNRNGKEHLVPVCFREASVKPEIVKK